MPNPGGSEKTRSSSITSRALSRESLSAALTACQPSVIQNFPREQRGPKYVRIDLFIKLHKIEKNLNKPKLGF